MSGGSVVAVLAVIGANMGRAQPPSRTRAIAPVVREVEADTRSVALDDASTQLTRVTAILPRDDGSFVVVDGRQRRLHFVTAQGRVTRTQGGNGQGPGEYRAVTTIDRLPSDSLVVLDGALRRVTVLSPTGEVGRVFTLVPPFESGGSPSTLVALGSGQLLIGFSEIRTMVPRPEAAYFTQRLFTHTTAGVVERGSAFSLPMSEHFVQTVPASMGGVAYWDRAFSRRTTLRALGTQVLVGDGSG